MRLCVEVDEKTFDRLADAAYEQSMAVGDYTVGLLREAMKGEWVSVHALMEMADTIRAKGKANA